MSPERKANHDLIAHLNQALHMLFDPKLTLFKSQSLPDMVDNILGYYLQELRGSKNTIVQLQVNDSKLVYVSSDTRQQDNGWVSPDLNQTVIPEKFEKVFPEMRKLILTNPHSFAFTLIEPERDSFPRG